MTRKPMVFTKNQNRLAGPVFLKMKWAFFPKFSFKTHRDYAFTIYPKTIVHSAYPPKFCLIIVLDFSWDGCNTQEKLELVVMQNFGG